MKGRGLGLYGFLQLTFRAQIQETEFRQWDGSRDELCWAEIKNREQGGTENPVLRSQMHKEGNHSNRKPTAHVGLVVRNCYN